jgi:hypothetical protein
MTKRPLNRKMKLTAVRNTIRGVDHLGCRATGIHKGHYIECTAWVPVDSIPLLAGNELELMASGKYRNEIKTIDNLEK